MTLLPSPLAQSTLSEKAALYLDHVTDNLPVFLHSLRPRLDPWLTYSTTSIRSVAQALPFDADEQTTAICAALLVSENDYSYITPDYIVDSPANNTSRHAQTRYDPNEDNNEPDIIALRHRGTIYPLHFRAYAIDDGVLTVGALREEAARQTGANNPQQVRLLYKGNLLKDDNRSCKAEGLKQHSEVLCVVSEVGANTPSEVSDSSRVDGEDEDAGSPEKTKKKNKKKKPKKKGPLSEPSRPGSTTPVSSSNPPLPPNLKLLPTAIEQVAALTGYLQQVLIPMCEEFFANVPTDAKKRDFEYKKLSETILAQIMLKADGIEPDGNVEVRNARKALIREAQSYLTRLDEYKSE
ncbi:uncharacterized protein N7503_010663 [Penicillium pulvis]|uniref:uncharacterized protein n=1 Tax=Penicillium pulvis TaxID=1562058 RepID=UPI00254953A4|nr:uncharacterized protein N7503_010663 [Penicillium pulvis]KAJ5785451.1 hypothetical protein N7503_010663 [Penicillium pulvis]